MSGEKMEGTFVFDPPLPALWSDFEVSPEQLKSGCQSDEESQKLYDTVLANFSLEGEGLTKSIPTCPMGSEKPVMLDDGAGKKEAEVAAESDRIRMPLLSLGGVPFVHALPFRSGRRFWGFFPPALYLLLNAIVIPLTIIIISIVNASSNERKNAWERVIILIVGFGLACGESMFAGKDCGQPKKRR